MAVKDKETILEILRENRETIRSYGVEKIGLFGSFARGQQHSKSDIDLLVEFQPGKKTFDNFMNLVFHLEDLLGRDVELVTTDSLSPYIGPRILKEIEYAA